MSGNSLERKDVMSRLQQGPSLESVEKVLSGNLITDKWPLPQTSHEISAVVRQLEEIGTWNWILKLQIAGFASRPKFHDGVTMRCQECIYYSRAKGWCALPALDVPVKPEWWCKLWRV